MPKAASPSSAFQHVLDETDEEIVGWHWTGSDEFSALDDRRDAPPVPLPPLDRSTRVVLVRHGQSTWNARNRIQGSSNFSVLTEKGMEQARAANKLLEGWNFTRLFHSPLKRAAQTAEIVWGGRPGASSQLASLREIDLYSFQGLDKIENRQKYPEQYVTWQSNPAHFIIDNHAPVRELWYRASLAWREVLGVGGSSNGSASGSGSSAGQADGATLVVAHNAVNQALLCTALGLPPAFFRRFSQSNASFTVLDFEVQGSQESGRSSGSSSSSAAGSSAGGSSTVGGSSAGGLRVRVERVNQFPDKPLNPSKLGKSLPNRLVLIAGSTDSPEVQASIQMLQSVGVTSPPLIGIGSAAQQALDIHTAMQAALSTPGDGRTVVAVACAEACQRMLGDCLGPVDPSALAEEQRLSAAQVGAAFCMAEGGMTIVNWPQGQSELGRGTVLCVNYQLPAAGLPLICT
ncbi:hypothetical protein COHA_000658 [Chlorella ohadii]|uniref:Phosphoglycerate mutase n=1 Tax=Chlorella ohadii TaxID=2649997 RepID=A0AAD5DY44_9CHLO|nr:hypothetical protein COHA_000658 [Chlorella ohadii]